MIDLKNTWITPNWQVPANIKAISTTRQGGFSQKPWDSLNLGQHVHDDPQIVEKNRQILAKTLGLKQPFIFLNQIHQNQLINIEKASQNIDADGAFSNKPQQVCSVMTADCLPVLMTNQTGTQVAAVHAGWRGLAKGILSQAVNSFKVPATEIIVWLGPCISQPHFEIDSMVYDTFQQQNKAYKAAFIANRPKHWQLDLQQLAKIILKGQGIQNISQYQGCTYADQNHFFSYRRDGECGRMASLIWIDDLSKMP